MRYLCGLLALVDFIMSLPFIVLGFLAYFVAHGWRVGYNEATEAYYAWLHAGLQKDDTTELRGKDDPPEDFKNS